MSAIFITCIAAGAIADTTTTTTTKIKLHGLSPPTERPPLVGEVSTKFLGIEGVVWSVQQFPTAIFSVF
jgi:hypothetical protein